MSRIDELEPEYLHFIKRKENIYGTPIVYTKPHEFDKLKAYVEAIDNSWKYELTTIANFIFLIPCFLLMPCLLMEDRPRPDYDAIARRIQSYRYILFPTMVVKLEKSTYGEVMENNILPFEQFYDIDMVWVDDVDKNER